MKDCEAPLSKSEVLEYIPFSLSQQRGCLFCGWLWWLRVAF